MDNSEVIQKWIDDLQSEILKEGNDNLVVRPAAVIELAYFVQVNAKNIENLLGFLKNKTSAKNPARNKKRPEH